MPVLDEALGDITADNVQGVLGKFEAVLDEAAGAPPPVGIALEAIERHYPRGIMRGVGRGIMG